MSARLLACYTPVAVAPPYINISDLDETTVRVIVRSAPVTHIGGGLPFLVYGPEGTIDIPREEFHRMVLEIMMRRGGAE